MSSVSSHSGGTLQSCLLQKSGETSGSLQPSGEEIPPRNLELVAVIAPTDASLKDELLLKHHRVIHSRVPPSRTPSARGGGGRCVPPSLPEGERSLLNLRSDPVR